MKKHETVILDFGKKRAARAAGGAVVIDWDGNEHPVAPFDLDGILEIVQLGPEFAKATDASGQAQLILRLKEVLQALVPTFPVGQLTFDEAMELIAFLPTTVQR